MGCIDPTSSLDDVDSTGGAAGADRMSAPGLAVIGMGGFAAEHHAAARRLEQAGLVRLVATCDPNPEAFSQQTREWELGARGVRVFDDYRTLLDRCGGEVGVLAVPTPINLHAEMHRAGVEAGVAVYLEKPPTLDPEELRLMRTTEERARHATLVGFNFVLEPERRQLKQRLLAGEFGRLREATFLGLWPRAQTYYARADWAGRLMLGDQLILDSPFGNAMAHFVNALLSWAGDEDVESRATVERARAELWRAHDIEGPDTFFVEARTSSGVTLRWGQTHATCADSRQPETLVCERATLRYEVAHGYEIAWQDGRNETKVLHYPDVVADNYRAYLRYLEGRRSRPPTTLADCTPFVELNGLAYLSSGSIHDFPVARVKRRLFEGAAEYRSVSHLDEALRYFVRGGRWPGESPRWVSPSELARLRSVVQRMRAEAGARGSSTA